MNKDKLFQDFFEDIALEAQAIDSVLTKERLKLQSSHALLGKSWYAVGLESNDSDIERDNANKQGIIRRMIDVVLNFIKRIIEKIKAFFAKNDAKKTEDDKEFIKNYRGPTDEQLIATINRLAKEEQPAMESMDAGSLGMASLEEAMKSFKHITGKPITKELALSAYQSEKLRVIRRLLGEYRISLLMAMLEEEFHSDYGKSTQNVGSAVTGGFSEAKLTTYLSQISEAKDLIDKCQEIVEEKDDENDSARTKTLMLWIVRGDPAISQRMNSYFESARVFEHTTSFLEKLGVYAEDLKDDETQNAGQKLETAQKVLSNLTSYISLSGHVINTNQLLVAGMQRTH